MPAEPIAPEIIAHSAAMKKVVEDVQKASKSEATVLITGESGTGKEVIAKRIHFDSDRRTKKLETVDMSAITETTPESELFGHEKGAFTGAIARKRGRFELAPGGSIFLDEIGEMSPSLQVKLLRVLQNRTFKRVGGEEDIHVDVRVIAATNRNLAKEVREGHFRKDLYFRLKVFEINVPPLRDRPEDITPLCEHFIAEQCAKENLPIKTIAGDALLALEKYSWPGNVRQLENLIIATIVRHRDVPQMELEHIQELLQDPEQLVGQEETIPPATPLARDIRRRTKAGSWAKTRWEDQVPRLLGTLIVHRNTEGSARNRLDTAHQLSGYMSRAVILEKRSKRAGGDTGRDIIRRVLRAWSATPRQSFSPQFLQDSSAGREYAVRFSSDVYDYTAATRKFEKELKTLVGWSDNTDGRRQPQLKWMSQLISIVNEGKSVFAPLLPGNGAEDVAEILRAGVAETAVCDFDVGSMDGNFVSVIRDAAGITDSTAGPCQVATALAGSAKRLVLVVRGWGLHAKVRGFDSLGGISQSIKSLKNCINPQVIVVAVSAVPLMHVVPPALVGSLAGDLNALVVSTQDEAALSEWASSELRALFAEEGESLVALTCSQLSAIRAAVRAASDGGDPSTSVRLEHARSGVAIYTDLAPCCQAAFDDVVRGKQGRAECTTAMRDAGILVCQDGHCAPRVSDWATASHAVERHL